MISNPKLVIIVLGMSIEDKRRGLEEGEEAGRRSGAFQNFPPTAPHLLLVSQPHSNNR